MTLEVVPLQAVPSQIVSANLGNQNCQLRVYQRGDYVFMDIYVNNALIIGGVICQNLNRVVRGAYLGFAGDFVFYDTEGNADPVYTGLGVRFQLMYIPADDLP